MGTLFHVQQMISTINRGIVIAEGSTSGLVVDVLVLCFNRKIEVENAVRSGVRPGVSKILVLDNGSDEPISVAGDATVIRSDENLGPCAGRNLLAARSTADLLLFLDDDAVIDSSTDVIQLANQFASDVHLAVLAGLVRRPDGHIAKHEFPARTVDRIDKPREVGYFVEGACMIRRSVFLELGGYDPTFFYGHEATDLSLRIGAAGHKIIYDPMFSFVHSPSPSGRAPTSNSFVRQMRNRRLLASRNLPFAISVIHLSIWFLYYLMRVSQIQVLDLYKLTKAALLPVPKVGGNFSRRRISFSLARRLHKTGYRIYW